MKTDIRIYPESNLIIVDVKSDRNKLLNIIVLAYTDDKKHILLKKAVFDSSFIFVHCKDYNVLDICEEIVNTYGDKSDQEKLWLCGKIFDILNCSQWGN